MYFIRIQSKLKSKIDLFLCIFLVETINIYFALDKNNIDTPTKLSKLKMTSLRTEKK